MTTDEDLGAEATASLLSELRRHAKLFEQAHFHASAEALRKRIWAIERHLDPEAVERHLSVAPEPDIEALRRKFEAQARCSFNFKRSRRGTYVNPPTARDWKWFQAGFKAKLP